MITYGEAARQSVEQFGSRRAPNLGKVPEGDQSKEAAG